MSLFLDTSDFKIIEKYLNYGVINGVTTNPSILLKDNKVDIDIIEYLKKISKLIAPFNLSLEVTTNDYHEMIEQAKKYKSIGENISVKITIHGPLKEIYNLEVVNKLENEMDIRVNVTAMMNAQQCILAAYAGATYVSIFGGRVNDIGLDSIKEIQKIRKIIDLEKLKAQIIVGSVRETSNVIDWLSAGAHIVTVPPIFIEKMIIHPHTTDTVKQFMEDGSKLKIF